jgi:hypothetical protein
MKGIVRILFISLFAATLGFADDTNLSLTVDGITYHNVRFVHPTPATVTIYHSTGVATIPLARLPPELQKQFGYDPQAATQWLAAQQQIDAATAETQRQQAARWQAEREKVAAEAAALAEAQRKAASAVQWKLRVQSVRSDGVVAWGRPSASPNGSKSITILLEDPPRLHELAEGDEITATAYRDGNVKVHTRTLERWVCLPSAPPSVANSSPGQTPTATAVGSDIYVPGLHNTGAFGFPQRDARILCNRSVLRFSVWNNDQYLFAQAVLWTDDDSSVGVDGNGQALGDYSQLWLDLDDDGKETPDVDRVYRLNQRPFAPGLHYAICKGNGGITGDKNDSAGRGAIRYVQADMPNRVRVDTYLIPLQEISKRIGDRIGMCLYASSPKPPLTVNSVTFDNYRPHNTYTEYVLTQGKGGPIDPSKVPEGRTDNIPSQ